MRIEEFKIFFSRLCKRWGTKYSDDKMEIYYECLSELTSDRMEEAIMKAIKTSKHFPTPDEIEQIYVGIKKQHGRDEECHHCEAGAIFWQKNGETYANRCAHCNKYSTVPLIARVGDAIFWAYRESNQKYEGSPVFYSDLNNMERIPEATFNWPASRNNTVRISEQERAE